MLFRGQSVASPQSRPRPWVLWVAVTPHHAHCPPTRRRAESMPIHSLQIHPLIVLAIVQVFGRRIVLVYDNYMKISQTMSHSLLSHLYTGKGGTPYV